MNINTCKQIIIDQREQFLRDDYLIDRQIKETYADLLNSQQIIAISGVRRCGKSSFLKIIARYIVANKFAKSAALFYVNFDDENFVDFTIKDFAVLLAAFHELVTIEEGELVYCFFDEIQNIPAWEKWINKLHGTGQYKIFITGSNSRLLSGELATSLTGRHYTLEILPFSYIEYLIFTKIDIPEKIGLLSSMQKIDYKKLYDKYLVCGGFPLAISDTLNVLTDYYQNIIYKDIITRFAIKNVIQFRETALFLLSNISSSMSYRSLQKAIEGLDSSMTAKKYVNYLEEAFLVFTVRKLESSVRKQLANPLKVYSIDNGLTRKIAYSISDNHNKLYENNVYLQLRRQGSGEIYYWKDNLEVDFIVKKGTKIVAVIQVCVSLDNPKTRAREENSLLAALRALDYPVGLIINEYQDESVEIDGKTIVYVPLWKFALENIPQKV